MEYCQHVKLFDVLLDAARATQYEQDCGEYMDNTIIASHDEVFGVRSKYAAEPDYFVKRMGFFESKYCDQFKMGWSEFFTAYSKNELPDNNFDFDEWGFLCEQMLYELTESSPPNNCTNSKEKSDTDSGFSFWGTGF